MNAIYLQSGGPTAVINSSAVGVITEWKKNSSDELFGARYGIVGLINNDLIDLRKLSTEELNHLKNTPSMSLGSSRYKADNDDIVKINDTIKNNKIGYIFINGGNGSAKFAEELSKKVDCNVILIPKTVDNDLPYIKYSPGFSSAANHVVKTICELECDFSSYNNRLIMAVEVMGRDAGWLAASSIMSEVCGRKPDLIYVPEVVFSKKKFIDDIEKIMKKNSKCFIVIAEGIKDIKGKYIFEKKLKNNENPYINMGGAIGYIDKIIRENFDCKVRSIDLGIMQRCSRHLATKIDLNEAFKLGQFAVKKAIKGLSGIMVTSDFEGNLHEIDLEDVNKISHTLPKKYINSNGNGIVEEYKEYIENIIDDTEEYISLK